jgi:mannose/fructose/N-acetylgalactosamine-specific phosphotransferase system component IID
VGVTTGGLPKFAVTAVRLFAVQSAFSYERMLGIGFGHAIEPLLRPLRRQGGSQYPEALARESRFFNAHPFLTSIAVGAAARAELDGEHPERIERLRTALCGPLGVIGDRLIWAGWLPACAGIGLTLVAAGAGAWGVAAFLVLFNVVHVGLLVWGLRAGWRAGMRVSGALANPFLQRGLEVVGPLAALAVGVAIPSVLAWFVRGAGMGVAWSVAWKPLAWAAVGAAIFAGVAHLIGTRLTALSAAILVLGVVAAGGVLWP